MSRQGQLVRAQQDEIAKLRAALRTIHALTEICPPGDVASRVRQVAEASIPSLRR